MDGDDDEDEDYDYGSDDDDDGVRPKRSQGSKVPDHKEVRLQRKDNTDASLRPTGWLA
jgi:hypothetical protein